MTWDYCVVGNGVSALWLSHWLWSNKHSVLWITSEEPYSPERAFLQHGWLWGVDAQSAAQLTQDLQGFDGQTTSGSFELAYYDARSSRRFRRWGEVKQEWGSAEKEFFEALSQVAKSEQLVADLWAWHGRLHRFHDAGGQSGPSQIELFKEPRFVRVQGWPLLEIKMVVGKIASLVLGGLKGASQMEIKATKFFFGDFDEHLPSLIKNEKDSQTMANALKGKAHQAGYGLRFWHKPGLSAPEITSVIPLVVNPGEKSEASHVVGRFVQQADGRQQSYWISFLTDAEVEDNNEILKKIKQTKRAIDRAIPGFLGSIEREAVTFEPKMRANALVRSPVAEALGAGLITDHFGAQAAVDGLQKIFSAKDKRHNGEAQWQAVPPPSVE